MARAAVYFLVCDGFDVEERTEPGGVRRLLPRLLLPQHAADPPGGEEAGEA